MNKLYRIILISIFSILSVPIIIQHTVVAQEANLPTSQEMPNRSRDNTRTQNQNVVQDTVQPQDMSDKSNAQNLRQRINAQDSSISTTPPTDRKDLRCQSYFVPRIINHQNIFKSKSQGRIAKYSQVLTRLENISTKLVEKGVDITTYNSYIAELKSKTDALNIINEEYISLLESNTNIATLCNDREQMSSQIKTRKEKLQLVIDKDKEIRMYIKDTIIVYLRSLQTQTNTSGLESSSTPSTNNNQVLPQQ